MQLNKYNNICIFFENSSFIHFNIEKGNKLLMIVYNKQTHEVNIYQKRMDNMFYTINDGVPVPHFGCSDSHGVYYYFNTDHISWIKEAAKNGTLNQELDKLEELKSLDEDANPVIFYYEFKN